MQSGDAALGETTTSTAPHLSVRKVAVPAPAHGAPWATSRPPRRTRFPSAPGWQAVAMRPRSAVAGMRCPLPDSGFRYPNLGNAP